MKPDNEKLVNIPRSKPFLARHLYIKVIFWTFFIILSIEAILLLALYNIIYRTNLSLSIQIEIFILIAVVIATLIAGAIIAVLKIIKNVYLAGDLDRTDEEINMIDDLRKALEEKQISLYYQPFVELKTKKIVGAEALIRWHHPVKGFIDTYNLIHIAEKNNLITPLGYWVLIRACKQAKLWLNEGYNIRISVNLSALQLKEPTLVENIEQILKESNLPAKNLELEITETTIIENMQHAIKTMSQLRNLGICISMDDFGTGYSSLSNLDKMPLDKLKIDKAFVNSISEQQKRVSVADSIVEMAHKLNLISIAEGIESQYQYQYFQKINCTLGQGFYFSKPLPAEKFTKLLQKANLPLEKS